MIEKHSLKTLEYYKIVDQLRKMSLSEGGERLCAELKPLSDYDEIQIALNETSDLVDYLILNPEFPLDDLKDIRPILRKANREQIPEIKD